MNYNNIVVLYYLIGFDLYLSYKFKHFIDLLDKSLLNPCRLLTALYFQKNLNIVTKNMELCNFPSLNSKSFEKKFYSEWL